jgi:DNA-directed RNA polymerase subunit beta
MLTIKSDDVRGRNMTYSSIIQNKSLPTPAIPESFKILTKYLQGIGIGMELEFEDESVVEANELFSSYRSEDETEKVQGGLVI